MMSAVSIGMGAVVGALLRWKLGGYLNHLFPTIPLGTLFANLLGGFIMGALLFLITERSFFSHNVRLGMVTGFLGSLTTFSTFSAEALILIFKSNTLWLIALIILHVGGSICMALLGYTLAKLLSHG